MIEDVFEGVFRVIGRFIGYFIVEILFEVFIKGTGYFIYKVFSDKEPDELVVTILGVMFWVMVGALAYMIYPQFKSGS